jgi:uncharacterized membrane protein
MALIKTVILSMLPISEVRGGIPYALASGVDFTNAFIFSILANILIVPLFFIFLDSFHAFFYKFKPYRFFFNKWVSRTKKRIEHRIGTKWELPMLLLFVAIPFPLTGAYTGTLAAWLFNINRMKAISTIALGIFISALIVSLLYFGFVSF